MVRLSDIARINGVNLSNRYIPITLKRINKGSASFLTKRVREGVNGGVTAFQIRIARDAPCYPNCITPIAGVIDHFKSIGITFKPSKSLEEHEYLSNVGLLSPFSDPSSVGMSGFINKVWKFTEDTHYEIVSGVMDDIYMGLEVERGVLLGIELCLNEITDNVLNHSRGLGDHASPCGFLMAQVHSSSSRIAISVFDTGIGIYKSLKYALPTLNDPREAISLSVRKGVTSGNGRGNGLWILERIVMASGGSLEITSGGVRYSQIAAEDGVDAPPTFSKASTEIAGTTLVDFQLDAHMPISLSSVLDYNPVDLWLESHEDDCNKDDAVIRLADESRGFGTRVAAKQMRVMAGNLSKEFRGRIIIDFDSVELVSTSYADELVAKLLSQEGMRGRLLLRNLNEACGLAVGEVVKDLDSAAGTAIG